MRAKSPVAGARSGNRVGQTIIDGLCLANRARQMGIVVPVTEPPFLSEPQSEPESDDHGTSILKIGNENFSKGNQLLILTPPTLRTQF